MTTSAILVLCGIISLLLCGYTLYKTMPRQGKPESAWTATETRAVSLAMGVLVLLFGGISMLLKGLLG